MIRRQEGFTIPELLVMTLVTSMFVTLIMTFMFGYWRYGYMLESEQDTLTTRLNAGDILREQVGQASGLINQNSIADDNANNPDPEISSGQYWETIHAIPGNKAVSTSGTTPLLYFRRHSRDSNNNVIMNGTQPYEDEHILYIDNAAKKLYLRSLANPTAVGNQTKTSCPVNIASSSCPADKVVADDLASIDMRYFSRTGNLIDYTSIWDPLISAYIGPDYPTVEVVEFTVNLSKKPIFQQTESTKTSTIIRIALRNT